MATRRISGESTSDLYIRLGLSLDELESGFVDAQRTIRDNMSRLWRENTIIDLQARVELSGLDEVADADRILEIRTEALNKQIKNQKDRVRLAAAELRNMEERTGAASDQSQRARVALEHHRLALARLEEQLRNLNDPQRDATDESLSLSEAFDNFARQCWNVIGVAQLVVEPIAELVEKFRELQTQAYELNMPVNDVENFLRHMRLAGGDIGDFEGYIRGITDAFVKGEWDDPEFIALRKYGAEITDVTGRLKNFEEITEEVYQAYLKAKAAGEEIEFLQLTGGESGVRDAIQYFERYAEAKEDAAKIFDAGIDPDELHEADRALKLLTEQLDEFKDAVINVGLSKAIEGFNLFFDVLHVGTEIVVEGREELQKLVDVVLDGVAGSKGFLSFLTEIKKLDESLVDSNELKETTASWADFKKEIDQAPAPTDNNPLSQYALKRIKDFRDELAELRIELDNWDNEYEQAKAELDLWKKNELTDKLHVSDDERIAIEELYAAKLEKIERTLADNLEDIQKEVTAELGNQLEKRFAAIEKTKDEWLKAGMEEAEAEELAEKLKTDAITKLEEEFTAKVDELHQNSLEKTLAAIEKEKQAWIDKGIEEVRATEWAEQAKADAIETEAEKLSAKQEKYEQQMEAYYDKVNKQAQEYAQKLKAQREQYEKTVQAAVDAQYDAAQKVLTSQIKEFKVFLAKGEKGLQELYLKRMMKQTGLSAGELSKINSNLIKAFQDASTSAQRAVFPNFNPSIPAPLTPPAPPTPPTPPTKPAGLDDDIARLNAALQSLNIPSEKLQQQLDQIDMPVKDFNDQLAQIQMPIDKLNEQLSHLTVPTAEDTEIKDEANNVAASFEQLSESITQSVIPNLTEWTNLIVESTKVFADMQKSISDFHNRLIDLVAYLQSLVRRAARGGGGDSATNNQPVTNNVTNNVSINEAHAWDSEHIQGLADRVAKVLEPEILSALRGRDGNVY